MLISICQSLVNVDRRSNMIFTSTNVASTISCPSTPSSDACVVLKFTLKVTGTITINGFSDTDGAHPVTETITMSASKIAVGVKKYKMLSSISLDSSIVSSGSKIEGKFTGKDGGNLHTTTRVTTAFPARISRGGANLSVPISGSLQVEKPKALLPYTIDFEPQDGDILTILELSTVKARKFMISGSPFIEMVGFDSHWVCSLERYEIS